MSFIAVVVVAIATLIAAVHAQLGTTQLNALRALLQALSCVTKTFFRSLSLTDACAVECSTSACNSIQSSNSCNGIEFFCSSSNLIQLWVARGFCSLFVFRLLTIRICRDLRQESLSGSVSSVIGLLTSLRYL